MYALWFLCVFLYTVREYSIVPGNGGTDGGGLCDILNGRFRATDAAKPAFSPVSGQPLAFIVIYALENALIRSRFSAVKYTSRLHTPEALRVHVCMYTFFAEIKPWFIYIARAIHTIIAIVIFFPAHFSESRNAFMVALGLCTIIIIVTANRRRVRLHVLCGIRPLRVSNACRLCSDFTRPSTPLPPPGIPLTRYHHDHSSVYERNDPCLVRRTHETDWKK